MQHIQIIKNLFILIFIGIVFSQNQPSVEELILRFNNERELNNIENAENLAIQILGILEIDPNLKSEDFANYLEFFATFYNQIEQDSISTELYFRAAKIYETEILRIQNKLIKPLKELDAIYNASVDTFAQSPYFNVINELNDSSRIDISDTLKINPYTTWFPEIRYSDTKIDSNFIDEYLNNEAIELTNIAISYYERGMFKDVLELLSQAITLDDKYLTHSFLTKNLFTNLDSTQLFLDDIFQNDSLIQLSIEKNFIIGLANIKINNFESALSQILDFQYRYPNQLRNDILLGDIYFNMENWFESLINYHWAIKKSPKNIHAQIGFSLCMMHRGDYQGARIVLEKLILNKINDHRVHHALGKIYFSENRLLFAIQQFNEALKLNPQIAEIYFDIGRVHLKSGRLSQALDAFTKCTQLEKENGDYHFYLGQVYEKILKVDDAIYNYQITRKFTPENSEANKRLGLLLYNKKLFRKAVEPLRDYIIHYPDSINILSIFSEVLLKESRFPEAIDGYSRLIQKNPENIRNYINLASAYKELNDFENAMYVYENALNYNDELADVYIDLAYTTYELGYYKKTVYYLLESMNCTEPTFNTNYLLGLAYGNLEKNFQAILAFNQAEILDSSDITISFQTGVLLMELKLFDEALIKFQNYEIKYPNDSVVQFLIGKCLYNLGEFETGILAFERAIKLNQYDSDSQFYIGLCLKQMGDLENAAIALKKATLLNPDDHLYHYEIGQIYLALGKLRLAHNEANILQLLGSSFYDSLNSLIQFNITEKDSSKERNNLLD